MAEARWHSQEKRERHPDPPRTYDGMVTRFIMSLTHRRPDKLKEIQNVMNPGASTLDMFSFMWDLREAHAKMNPSVLKSKKSDKNSFIYWRLGNTHLSRKDKDLALKYFNLSIQLAPHPPIIVDDKVVASDIMDDKELSGEYYGAPEGDPGSHNPEGWGDYVSLCYAYEARACLLLEMEQYKKCIRDIDIVLELGCPPPTAAKLHEMRQICEEKIVSPRGAASPIPPEPSKEESPSKHSPSKHSPSKHSPSKHPPSKSKPPRPKSFRYRCPDPPVIVDPSPTIPAFTSSVRLAYNKDIGRHLVASRSISHGELVAVEEGFCTAVRMEHLRTFCVVCMKRTLSPLPCPSCSLVVFCSQHCRIQGLANEHWQECPLMFTLMELNMGINPILALRLLTKLTYAKLREMAPRLLTEAKHRTPRHRGFDDEDVYDHSHYRTVFHLVTNKERRGYKDLLGRAMEAFMILKLLQTSGRYFKDAEGKDFQPREEDLIFTGSMLMHHMMNLPCNSGGIFEVEIVGREVDKNPLRVYGAGIFPAVSLMSHACYASCVVLSYGKYRVVKACRAIPAGAQLTCQYIDVVKGNLRERRARLLPQYFFVCRCEACEKNWPDGLQYTTAFNLKCVRCHTSITYNTKKCSNCNLYYKGRSAVPNYPYLFTYDYNIVRKKIEQALKDYKRAEYRLIKKGSESEADVRVVSDLIELYDEYVELPAYIHVAAQSTYNSMSYLFASSAYSIEDNSPQCQVS